MKVYRRAAKGNTNASKGKGVPRGSLERSRFDVYDSSKAFRQEQ